MKELIVEIITPSKTAYKGEVKSITLPGTLGNFQVLFNHAPLLSSLEIGRIKIVEAKGNILEFVTSGGTVEILKNKVLVLADSVESVNEIDVERARQSYSRAKERLGSRKIDIDVLRAEASLQRALNRIKFAGAGL
ncbi:MAG: F0F1 ATP synthase subunit epsilon [Ignavibacteriales bacterium]|nr:F0F1 ATP synthase subunit epsilon [Ignavibacteriales bacterium]